jgi:hypothetical protein
MELRAGVAYDVDLVTDVSRQLRPEICTLELEVEVESDAVRASA